MKFARTLAALTLAGSATLATNTATLSAPLLQDNGLRSATVSNGIENVQWRGHRHGWHGHRHWHGRPYWRDRSYGWGPAIGGLAAGAIIGGAIASGQAQAANEAAYCSQRFKSYDPASGTYLGYDGLRHPCP
ncbi:BA14K family protein [Bradyrhizobium sp. LHD-71]|uniref:BA14K family protein n=1 Tax=Bradyrhizobium sp. LHD-71 TaxID=3072141 RepID=UPI00280E59A8|nr:BA14K family protein [Bradyrhizobium sp. LHD-71]MDQ8728132.1 BA14K family protein [Bradyrhizobium sp. LHD-71]